MKPPDFYVPRERDVLMDFRDFASASQCAGYSYQHAYEAWNIFMRQESTWKEKRIRFVTTADVRVEQRFFMAWVCQADRDKYFPEMEIPVHQKDIC